MLINHPECYKAGTHVVMRKGRHKDGAHDQRIVVEVSHSAEHFDRIVASFIATAAEGERIYASVGSRDMPKAIRTFKQRQLDADYDDDPQRFYRGINERWVSCLMAPTNQSDRWWLFDCDTPEHLALVNQDLALHYDRPAEPYTYASKSGHHVIVAPFDKSKLSPEARSMIHDNPIMLWYY